MLKHIYNYKKQHRDDTIFTINNYTNNTRGIITIYRKSTNNKLSLFPFNINSKLEVALHKWDAENYIVVIRMFV